MTPANLHMWLHSEIYAYAPEWMYSFRLLLQVWLIWLIWWSTRLAEAWYKNDVALA